MLQCFESTSACDFYWIGAQCNYKKGFELSMGIAVCVWCHICFTIFRYISSLPSDTTLCRTL